MFVCWQECKGIEREGKKIVLCVCGCWQCKRKRSVGVAKDNLFLCVLILAMQMNKECWRCKGMLFFFCFCVCGCWQCKRTRGVGDAQEPEGTKTRCSNKQEAKLLCAHRFSRLLISSYLFYRVLMAMGDAPPHLQLKPHKHKHHASHQV